MNQVAKQDLPTITVITPNYNYGEYLEATIDSVLSQGYPNLRYVVIDGGSTDRSVEIIKRYESHIYYWHSRPDMGQAHAINQGLKHGEGAIVNWINSDDQLAKESLWHVADCSQKSPSALIATSVLNRHVDWKATDQIIHQNNLSVQAIVEGHAAFHQPGSWWNTKRLKELGGVDARFNFCFDYLLLLRYLSRWPEVTYSSQITACFNIHPSSKTSTSQHSFEQERQDSLRLLLHDPEMNHYHRVISARLRSHAWHHYLFDLNLQKESSRSRKIVSILLQSLKDPQIRVSRLTAGAIRRLLA